MSGYHDGYDDCDDDGFDIDDPATWKEHFPGDPDYVPYVYSLEGYFNLKQKLVEYLSTRSLTYYEREAAEYKLRAVERDGRTLKISPENEGPRRKQRY
jgi:hypothetical protein